MNKNLEVYFVHIVLIEPEIPGNTGNIARLCAATNIELHLVLSLYKEHKFYYSTTKAPHAYTEVAFGEDDLLVFGKETAGIPEEILKENWQSCIRIPMISDARSLNLSNAVAIVAYEAMRQMDFSHLKQVGFDHLD